MEAPSIAGTFFVKYYALHTAEYVACSRLSVSGVDAKENDTPRWGEGEKKEKEVSSHFIFVFALSQFSGPDYLGAWNMLQNMQWIS